MKRLPCSLPIPTVTTGNQRILGPKLRELALAIEKRCKQLSKVCEICVWEIWPGWPQTPSYRNVKYEFLCM